MDLNQKSYVALGIIAIIAAAVIGYEAISGMDDPEPVTYSITVQASDENGQVSGGGTYDPGAEVTLTATPSDGYGFEGWFVNGELVSTESEYEFKAEGDMAFTGSFQPYCEITANVDGAAGAVLGDGKYMLGQTACLSAYAMSGYAFDGWYDADGVKLSSSNMWAFVVEGDTVVEAKFVAVN